MSKYTVIQISTAFKVEAGERSNASELGNPAACNLKAATEAHFGDGRQGGQAFHSDVIQP